MIVTMIPKPAGLGIRSYIIHTPQGTRKELSIIDRTRQKVGHPAGAQEILYYSQTVLLES